MKLATRKIELTKGKKCPFKWFSKCKSNCALYISQPFNTLKSDEKGELIRDAQGNPAVDECVIEGCVLVINHRTSNESASSLTALSHMAIGFMEDHVQNVQVNPGKNVVLRQEIPPHLMMGE